MSTQHTYSADTVTSTVYDLATGKNPIGQIESKLLRDKNGDYILKPDGNPYIVPINYDPYKTIDNFQKLTFVQSILELKQYNTGGSRDIQRGYEGVSFNGFVPDYTPIASFDVGVAGRAAGTNLNITEFFGGL